MKNTLKFYAAEVYNRLFAIAHQFNHPNNEKNKFIVNELKQKGYFVLEEYISKSLCNEIINDIEKIISEYRDKIWIDKAQSDHRIFGAEKLSEKIFSFYNDDYINSVLQCYENASYKAGFTLGAKLEATENNLGSGGGWHRDSVYASQTKALIYLTDVLEDNGPFQFIEGSHTFKSIVSTAEKTGLPVHQNRLTEDDVTNVLKHFPEKLKTFTGKAGSVLLVDTRGIHRGKPIDKGVRYALTNYNWVKTGIPNHIMQQLIKP